MTPRNPQPPAGLVEAFRAYEQALATGDATALVTLFAPGETTLRGDADGLLVGHDTIVRTLATGASVPQRRLVQTHVQTIDDEHALVVAVTEAAGGGRGQQTQLWARVDGWWRITAAHDSAPAAAFDGRIWRILGDPLVSGTDPDGALGGETVAVKDVFAVAGQRVGAGHPEWLQHAAVESEHADAVGRLLDAGADVRGIARTVELAYSLTGANPHYGTPPNPRAPHRLPGGSSSGSATAVSLGHATIGLGADTAGSIRVPAAYQGLYGIRTTHGLVPTAGMVPLAPSYDAVGWLTRSAFLLRAVGDVLLPEARTDADEGLVVVPELLDLATPDVAGAIRAWLPGPVREEHWPLHRLADWVAAFRVHQGAEAWRSHGEWLAPRLDTLGADVRGRFEDASRISPEQAQEADRTAAAAGQMVRDLVADRVVVVPGAPSVAPRPGDDARDATLRLTCLASLGGLPAVTIPLRTADGLPTAACLVAGPGRDRDLLDLTVRLADETR
jgi:Asp-tRNA(Asn)/Glu-tRNA(Gln) amidotransferase A subunit family amidase